MAVVSGVVSASRFAPKLTVARLERRQADEAAGTSGGLFRLGAVVFDRVWVQGSVEEVILLPHPHHHPYKHCTVHMDGGVATSIGCSTFTSGFVGSNLASASPPTNNR